MAEPAPLQFAAQAYMADSLPLDAQQCINMYVEKSPPDAKTLVPIFGVPGIKPWLQLGTGPILSVYNFHLNLLIVSGQQLFLIIQNQAPVMVGAIGLASRPSVSDNGIQVVYVNGQTGWVYQPGGVNFETQTAQAMGSTTLDFIKNYGMQVGDPIVVNLDNGSAFATTIASIVGTTSITLAGALPSSAQAGSIAVDTNVLVAPILDPNFHPAHTVTYFDTYMVFDWVGTNKFFISAQNDATQYPVFGVGEAESQPGFMLAVLQLHEMLMLLAQDHIETWYDAGTLDFPFARFDGGTIERGLAAPMATAIEDNTFFWLGEDKVFYRLNSFTPVRISTHALEAEWEKYDNIGDAFCMALTWNGHKWIVITFPSAGTTFVYDVSTGLWHRRISWNSQNQDVGGGWRVNSVTKWFSQWIVGDRISNQVGVLDDATYTEWGNTILGLITSPQLHAARARTFMPIFELDVETGVGTTAGPGAAPQVQLDWSDDGARTWSKVQLSKFMGKQGEYKVRLRWSRMGQFRQRTLRLRVTDPVKRRYIGTYALLRTGLP